MVIFRVDHKKIRLLIRLVWTTQIREDDHIEQVERGFRLGYSDKHRGRV